jgi:low affinity Fe/Cu permease
MPCKRGFRSHRRARKRGFATSEAVISLASLFRANASGNTSGRAAFTTMDIVRRALTRIGVLASHPLAFVIIGVYVAVWLAFDHRSFGWQGFATVATWMMTLFIQRAEHRDTQAIHAKLDELLRAEGCARNEFTVMDQKEPEEIERHRMHERQ